MKNGVKFSISIFHAPAYVGSNPIVHLNKNLFDFYKNFCYNIYIRNKDTYSYLFWN